MTLRCEKKETNHIFLLCTQAHQSLLELPFQKLNRSLCWEIDSNVPIQSQLRAPSVCFSLRNLICMALGPEPCIVFFVFICLFLSDWRMMLTNKTTQERECGWKDERKVCILVCGSGHCLPLRLSVSIQIKQCFSDLCVPTCCTCSCRLLSITVQLNPLQVPGQHFLIAFLVPVMLRAALLLAIHHPAIVAVSYLSHVTSPAKHARRRCQWAAASQDVAWDLLVILISKINVTGEICVEAK